MKNFGCAPENASLLDFSWNVMAHGDAREGKRRGNWWMEWVARTLHTTSEHGVSSITTAEAHTSAASSRLNWRPRRFIWTRPFRRKTKSGFCACAITFQLASTCFTWEWNAVRTVCRQYGVGILTGLMQLGLRSAVVTNGARVQQRRGSLATVSLWRPLIILDLETDGWREIRKLHGGSSTENLNKNHSENIRSPRTSGLRALCYSHIKQRLFP
jgi:hypothetical protein